jgi:hypothetical protein
MLAVDEISLNVFNNVLAMKIPNVSNKVIRGEKIDINSTFVRICFFDWSYDINVSS